MGTVVGVFGNQGWIEINLGRTQLVKHRLAALGLPPGDTTILLLILSVVEIASIGCDAG